MPKFVQGDQAQLYLLRGDLHFVLGQKHVNVAGRRKVYCYARDRLAGGHDRERYVAANGHPDHDRSARFVAGMRWRSSFTVTWRGS